MTLFARGEAAYEQRAELEDTKGYIAVRVRDVPAVDRGDKEIALTEHCDRGKDSCLPESPAKSNQNNGKKVEQSDSSKIQME
jgi:hypothetical protein